MELKIREANDNTIAEVISDQVKVNTVQDAVDLMANADYQGARSVIIYEKNLAPEFFDLKTKMAGDILQKYSNYRMQLAIVGDFEKYQSNSLNAFIIECNRGNHIFYVDSLDSAIQKLSGK